MKLGDKILKLRREHGLSQEQLGDKINVTRQTISNWELGETSPNPEQLKLLSKELDVSIDELLDNDIKRSNDKILKYILIYIKISIIICICVILILLVLRIMLKKKFKEDGGLEREETIYCEIYGEEHSYSIRYYENNDIPIGEGGDSYFYDILDLGKYNYAHQIFNVINDYVKKNGGTCAMFKERYLYDIVDMEVKDITSTGLTVVISENIDYDISYGESFWIEKYNSGTGSFEKMEEIGNNCGFNLMAYKIEKGKQLELKQNWDCMYGELDKGLYRLVKDVFFESDIPVDEDDIYYVSVEFEIE